MRHLLCRTLRAKTLLDFVRDRSRRSRDPLLRFQIPTEFPDEKKPPRILVREVIFFVRNLVGARGFDAAPPVPHPAGENAT